ncbi:unnamed protein product, partial [Didymodactylos carnosus]
MRDLSEVANRQKRTKLTDLNSQLNEFTKENNIDVNQVLGYVLYQRNYNTKKHLAKLGDELYRTGNIAEAAHSGLDLDHTLALKTHINMSRNDMDFIKSYFR